MKKTHSENNKPECTNGLETRTRELLARYPTGFTADKEGLIAMMLDQFASPFLCYREIIQNAIDECSSRVNVTIDYDKQKHVLNVAVEDDGAGMDWEKLKRYLTLFDSTKEDDVRSIGEMGVGKIFALALDPRLIIVETGNETEGHKVIINNDMSGQIRKIQPRKGTKVSTVFNKCEKDVRSFIRSIVDTIEKTCSYVSTPVYINARKINKPFDFSAECKEEFKDNFTRGVVALTGQTGYKLLKGGIVLEEGRCLRRYEESGFDEKNLLFPEGLEVMIDSYQFNQPISRNSVCRDCLFFNIVARAQEAIDNLTSNVVRAYQERMNSTKNPDGHELMRYFLLQRLKQNRGGTQSMVLKELPLFQTVDGKLATFKEIEQVGIREGNIYYSDREFSANEITYFTERGIPVVEASFATVKEHFHGSYGIQGVSNGLVIEGLTSWSRAFLDSTQREFLTMLNKYHEMLRAPPQDRQQSGRSKHEAQTCLEDAWALPQTDARGGGYTGHRSFDWDKIQHFQLEEFKNLQGRPRKDLTLMYAEERKTVFLNTHSPYVQAMMRLSKINPSLSTYYVVSEVANSKSVFPYANPKEIEQFLIAMGQAVIENGKAV